jgi:hypothetical protein
MWKALLHARQGKPTDNEKDMSRCSLAVESLHTMEIREEQQVWFTLALGIYLGTYEMVVRSMRAHTLRQHALLLIKPWYPKLLDDPALYTDIVCIIWQDTAECLLRRQVPILQFRVGAREQFDHVGGISTGILPILYNVCKLCAASKPGVEVDEGIIAELVKTIRQWRPHPSVKFHQLRPA